MKYALIGAALSGNKGAAAMIEATIDHVSEFDTEATFTLLTSLPEQDRALNHNPAVTVMSARPVWLALVINSTALLHRCLPPLRGLIERSVPAVGAIAHAEAYLDLSGISFMDSRSKFLIYNLARTLPPLFLGTPAVKLGQAMGPFHKLANKLAAKALLPKLAAIVSRGSATRMHLDSLGLTNVHDGADLAFTLRVTPQSIQEAESSIDTTYFESGDVVGFSPSSVLEQEALARGEDYVSQVVSQIDYLTSKLGRKVFVIAHAARASSTSHVNNDLAVCRKIVKQVDKREHVLFVDAELSAGAQRHLIGKCDIFIASRFHAMVSALACGVPPVVIGWSHKYREVLEMFGIAAQAVSHEGLTVEKFTDLVATALANAGETRVRLAGALPSVQALAMKQFDIVRELVSH